ncbi:MAG: H-NS histone family protein [Proteobacteria bacterium]|nr:H-NS histone family protein [Pseudomonadota bacterium]
MSIDIEKLSAKELKSLISLASQRKKKLDKRKPAAGVRRQILAIAKKGGYTIAELFGTGGKAESAAKPVKRAARKAKGPSKVAPKYRNPADPNQTWAGRGKPPKWMAVELANGKTREDFAIQ